MHPNGDRQLMHRLAESTTQVSCGPLTRESVRPFVKYYLEHDYHAVLFMNWEIKPVEGHPENDVAIDAFIDILEKMGLVIS